MTDLIELQNEMDAIVHALGIEDSHVTPVEKINELFAELARLRGVEAAAREVWHGDDQTTFQEKLERLHGALSGTPPPLRVDDAMVERACKIVHQETWKLQGAEAKAMLRNRMHAALTAAIGGQDD